MKSKFFKNNIHVLLFESTYASTLLSDRRTINTSSTCFEYI